MSDGWLETTGDDAPKITGYGGALPEDQPGGETYDWNSYHGIGDRSNKLSANPEHQSVALTPEERLARFGVSGKSTGRPFNYNGQTYYDDDTAAQFFKGRDEGRRIDVYQGESGGVMGEHSDTPDKTKVSELPEHLDLEGWDQPHNIPAEPQETVEAPLVAKRSLIQEFHDKYPNITTSDQGILAQMHEAYAPTMPEDQFKAAATTPGGRDIIKEWQERTKTPLEQIRDKHPEWSNYSDDKLSETLYTEWTKNKQLDAGKMSLSQFKERMKPTSDAVNQTAKFIEQAKDQIPKKFAAWFPWTISNSEQQSIDQAEPVIKGILDQGYPGQDVESVFKQYAGLSPDQRRKKFMDDWGKTQHEPGLDPLSMANQLEDTFTNIDKKAQIEESIGWMKKAVTHIDTPGPYQLPSWQEKSLDTISGIAPQAFASLFPGFRELTLFGNLYGQNKAAIEQNNPGMGKAEIAQRAENATWWQFPANELLQLSFVRGGPAIAGTIANRLKTVGVQLGTEAVAGAGVGGANQVITNIAAGRDPLYGVGESAGTMATLGLVGRGVGLTVEGLNRAQTQVPEIRRATGISADIVGATPEEANKIVKGDPTAQVNLKATRNSIDLILSAHAQREAEKGNVPAWQVAREAEISAGKGKTPASESFEKAQTARNNGDLKTAQKHVDQATASLEGKEKKDHQEAVADSVKGLTKNNVRAKLKNVERYMGLNKAPGKRGEAGGMANPFGGTRRPKFTNEQIHAKREEMGLEDTPNNFRAAKRELEGGEKGFSGDANIQMASDVGLSLQPAVRLGEQVVPGSDHWDAAQAFSQLYSGSSLRRSGLGIGIRLPSKRTEDLPATGLEAHNLEQGYIGPNGKFFTRDQVSQLIRDSRQQTFSPGSNIEGKLIKAFKAVSARTGNPNIYIADLVKESGLPLDQVKAWISKEGVEKGRFDLNEGDIGAARSTGRQDVADAAVDMFGRKRVYVDLSRLTQGGEEAEAFSGGNPLALIRQATKDLGSSEAVKKVVDPVARTFAPEHRGQAAEETAAIVKPITARVKNGIQQGIKIIAKAHDMDSFLRDAYRSDRRDAWWGNFSDEQIAAWQSMRERGESTGNEIVDKFFDFTRDVYDWLEELGRENGIDFGHFSDYFHHAFKNTEGEVQQQFKDWEPKFGKQAFQKTRHYPTLADALEAGLKPKSYSPERNLMAYAAAMTTAIRQVQTLKEMSEFNLALPTTDVKEQGLTKQPGWTLYTAPDKQSYYVRNDAAGLLANAFDLHSIYDTIAGPFVAFSRAMKAVTGLKLSWSVFHPLHIATNMWTDVLSTSMQRGLQGTGTAKDFYDALYSTLTVGTGSMVSAYRKYAWLVEALQTGKGLENLSDHQMRDYNDVLDMALNPYMGDDRRAVLADMLFRGWNGARKARDWSEAGYKFLTAEPWNEFMFGKVIPCVKIASALARRDTLLQKHGESYRSPENMAWKLDLSKINNEVEARFGEMSYDNLFWNRMAKQIGTAVPLSLGWNLGFLKMYGGGVVDFLDNAAHVDQITKYVATKGKEGRPFNASNRLLYMVNYTLGTMAVNGIMTYLMTGTMPQGMDFFFPRIGKKANGDDERVRTPYWTGEWASMYEHFKEHRDQNLPPLTAGAYAAADYFGNKANPGLASIWHLMNNKSFMGRDISDMRDPWQKQLSDQVAFVLKDMLLPISAQSLDIGSLVTGKGIKFTDASGLPLEPKQVAMSFLGFTGAPTSTTRTPLQNKIITMFHQQMNMHMGKRESDIFDAKTRYQYAIQSGDQAMQREELANLHQLQAGPRVIEDARKNAKVPPAHRAYKGLTWENQSYLLKHMNPSEYHEYWPLSHPEAKMDYVKTQ